MKFSTYIFSGISLVTISLIWLIRENALEKGNGNKVAFPILKHSFESSGKMSSRESSSSEHIAATVSETKNQIRDHSSFLNPTEPLPVATVSEFPVIEVSSSKPGNSMTVAGQQVSILGYQPTAQGNALTVIIEPLVTLSSASFFGEAASEAPGFSPDDDAPVLSKSSRAQAGFTHEEELFRAKWGWAAFAKVKSEAVYHPENSP